jgi:WD40 repeat protein
VSATQPDGSILTESLQQASPIFSLALSPDERLLACGGPEAASVTLWNIRERTIIARFVGLSRQAHALAFTPDATRIAAANLWGGVCVWNIADGRVVATRPETKSRRHRTLVYPETQPSAQYPVMLSDSIARTQWRTLASRGDLLAVNQPPISIRSYRSATELASLDLSSYALTRSGVTAMTWSGDSQVLALAGSGWVGVWAPLAPTQHVYALELPFAGAVDGLAVAHASRRIIYARGQTIAIAGFPAAPLLTAWQEYLRRVPPLPDAAASSLKREWTWNVTQWGYDGVHTFEGQLVWYSHSHNPHAGGGATTQSFTAFLQQGPAHTMPEPMLIELCQSIKILTSAA